MNESIRNIVFDMGGVLIDLDLQRVVSAFEALGMPRVARLINPYYPAEVFGRLERGDISAAEAFDQIRALEGRTDVSDRQIADAFAQFLSGIPKGRLQMIRELRRRGLHTYVLSNNSPILMPRIREMFRAEGLEMEDYFDRIYFSFELRELKPSPEIFRKMIADSGIRPEESLFIDDGQRNVNAARALGFSVYMPAPHEEFGHLFDAL